jgi:hypothetical protein
VFALVPNIEFSLMLPEQAVNIDVLKGPILILTHFKMKKVFILTSTKQTYLD